MITTDVHFAKGYSHNICEDYGLAHNSENLKAIIIADGCSTGENSDLASRIISHLGLSYLTSTEALASIFSFYLMELRLKIKLEIASELLGLGDLLSTLFATFIVNNNTLITVGWGDGYIVTKYKNMDPIITKIEFDGNIPNYLWYKTNPSRYNINGSNMKINGIQLDRNYNILFTQSINNNIEYTALFTDGIDSIVKYKQSENNNFGEKITSNQAIEHLTNFKSVKGSFVKRRMNRFLNDITNSGFIYEDDITCAVMHF